MGRCSVLITRPQRAPSPPSAMRDTRGDEMAVRGPGRGPHQTQNLDLGLLSLQNCGEGTLVSDAAQSVVWRLNVVEVFGEMPGEE